MQQLSPVTPLLPSVQDWRRLLHVLRQGLASSRSAALAHEDRAAAAAIRARQIRARRIVVMGSTGGAGTTTVAILLASVLSAARDDQTMVLTAHSDPCDAALRLAISNAPSVTDVVAGLHRLGRIPPTPVTTRGLRVLAAPPPGGTGVQLGLAALLEAAASGHACVVVDVGVAGRIADLGTLLELADTVVLVCATSIDAVRASSAVLSRWQSETAQGPGTTRLIGVAVRTRCRRGTGVQELAQRLSATGGTAHGLPYDPELARGAAIDLGRLSGPTLTAVLGMAADIMGQR